MWPDFWPEICDTMKPSTVQSLLGKLVTERTPVFLWGPPGIGKSALVRQTAQAKKLEVRDLRLSQLDPTDLRGLPFFDAEARTAVWAPPAFLPTKGRGVLFLDEINAAMPAVQAAAYQLVLDRRIGEYVLPEGWSIVAAGNREGDRGVTYRLSAPLANRFMHLNVDVCLEDWKAWAFGAGVHADVIGFLGFRPELLFRQDTKSGQHAFPTPRTWEGVGRVSGLGLPDMEMEGAVQGLVGEGPALEFLAYRSLTTRLPCAEAILAGDNSIPEDTSTLYALAGTLTYAVRQDGAPRRLGRFLDYTRRWPTEFAVLAARDALKAGVRLTSSPAWADWSETFAEVVL